MLHRMYLRTLALAASPRAPWWLAVVAFAESSFFPIPPDALLVPMSLARPDRAWRFARSARSPASWAAPSAMPSATSCSRRMACRWRTPVRPRSAAALPGLVRRWGLAVILIKGLTPIPYKLVTIASGAAEFNFPVFMAASIVTRGARFFLVAALLRASARRCATSSSGG